MKVSIKDEKLIIEIPISNPPRPSKSGKTLVVATTSGFVPTTAEVNNQPISISLNATVRK